MTSVLRLRRRSDPPEPNRNTEAIYADADGGLQQVASDGTVTAIGGVADGGSQTVNCVRFPIAFDTPGLVPDSFPIIAVDLEAQTITVAGNRTAAFAVGVSFAIFGSTGPNTTFTVTSVSLVGSDTVIGCIFSDPPPSGDGNAVVAVGVTVYTPAVEDILLGNNAAPVTLVSVSEAWNGTTPALKVLTEAGRQAQSSPFVNLDATVADDPNGAFMLSAIPGFDVGTSWRLWRFTTADPVLVTVDDNNGLDPGATQGAAEIVLLILAAQ